MQSDDELIQDKFRELKASTSPETQLEELNKYLDNFGEISGAGTPLERVKRVVMHYATQGARWNKQTNEARKKNGFQYRR